MFKLARENTRIALGSIRSQILRTSITVFIIAIGIWALVGILSVVSALKNTLLTEFSSMGANTFSITQYDFSDQINKTPKPNPIITYNQAKAFKESNSHALTTTSISFTAASNTEVKYESLKTDPEVEIVGADEHFFYNSGLDLSLGRSFNALELANNSLVCVVGSDFSKGLFKDRSPIDQYISIRGTKFKIVGLLKEKGSTFGKNEDQRVFIPLQLARALFSQPAINYVIKVRVQGEDWMKSALDDAVVNLRNIRKLNPSQANNFGVERSDELIKTLLSQTDMLEASAWMIGFITVMGSSIALMNIMLVSVTERTREIGIRKSLGAKRKTIAWQFFTETLIIGQLGGLLGTLLGIGTGYAISLLIAFHFTIPWTAILSAFITTFVVAILSGLYPAIKASKLDPVEALRYE